MVITQLTGIRERNREYVVPLFCLILLPVFAALDSFTTYLALNTVESEANPLVRYIFNWGWTGVIIWSVFIVLLTLLLTVLSNGYILESFQEKNRNRKMHGLLLCLSFFMSVCFYTYFIGSIYASINNYLVYLSVLKKTANPLYDFAVVYAEFTVQKGSLFYYLVLSSITALLGALIAFFRITHVKKYVQTTIPPGNP